MIILRTFWLLRRPLVLLHEINWFAAIDITWVSYTMQQSTNINNSLVNWMLISLMISPSCNFKCFRFHSHHYNYTYIHYFVRSNSHSLNIIFCYNNCSLLMSDTHENQQRKKWWNKKTYMFTRFLKMGKCFLLSRSAFVSHVILAVSVYVFFFHNFLHVLFRLYELIVDFI